VSDPAPVTMTPRTAHILLVLSLLVALLRFVLVALHVHPFADDWSYTVAGGEMPLLDRLVHEHRSWNGRWASNILVLRNPMQLGLDAGLMVYRAVPLGLLGLNWLGAFVLWRALFTDRSTRGQGALAATVLLLLYLQVMPDLGEGIYWYTGAVSYQLPSALLLFLAACWVCLSRGAEGAQRIGLLAAALVLAFFIAGSSETHAVLVVLLHAGVLLAMWRTGGMTRAVPIFFLALSIGLALFMVLAPGNAVRAEHFPERGQILHTVFWGGLQTARFVATWITEPALVMASVLWVTLDRRLGLTLRWSLPVWWVLVVLVGLVWLLMALPYWATGILGQHRTVNVACFLFLPGWLLFLSMAMRRSRWADVTGHLGSQRMQRWTWALFLGALFLVGSGRRVGMDLLDGRLAHYDAGVMERYGAIQQAIARGEKELHLAPIEPMPRSLRILDAGPDPEHWGNSSLVRYFGGDLKLYVGDPTAATK
jgi:hypothetical protein